MCGPKWSDDIEFCAKNKHYRQEAQGGVVLI